MAEASDQLVRDPGSAPLEALAMAFGQSYAEGPFEVPHRCPRAWPFGAPPRPWVPARRLCAVFIVRPGSLARCFNCQREFTTWHLRRLVLEDPRLARRLGHVLQASP